MVRKTKTSIGSSSKADEDSSTNETEKRQTFIILSFPLVALFNFIKLLLFEIFVVLKFVYNTSSRVLNKPSTNQEETVNLEVVKGDDNKATEMDLLQRQKQHHKKAFEFISQALKIDETQNTGVCVIGRYSLYGNLIRL